MRLASDEREHRRGLVLGLTMAEVLLLLLFLLLLALAARLMTQAKDLAKANETVQVLRPLIEAVKGGDQIRGETIQALAQDLASVPQLKRDNETLKVALADTTRRLDAYRQVEARARELNPNDPPAALRSGLELLAKHGELSVRAEALSRLEKDAQAVDPSSPPQQTIQNALTFMKSAGQFGADVKMAGQIRQQVAVLKDTEQKIDERMKAAFGGKLAEWGAVLDDSGMSLRFQKEGVLFDRGNPLPRQDFKRILNDLFPTYIRILHDFDRDIEEVRIEGHTSSEWDGKPDPMEAYFANMALSQDRTRAVLEYSLTQTQLAPALKEWARKRITANGLSSSRPREIDGREDKDASRRVEFRVLTKAKEQLLRIVEPSAQ